MKVVGQNPWSTLSVVAPNGYRIEGLSTGTGDRSHAGACMILSPSRSVRVFAYPAPVDLRKGYNGLYGVVEQGLKHDPMNGDLFLF